MKVTLATGGEINITEADRRLPCELCCVVGYSGGLYLLTDEKHESGHHVRGNTGEEIELDVIAICCEYAVDDVSDIADNYSIDIAGMDDDDAREAVLDYLNENTTVVDSDCSGQIIYCTAF